MKKILLVLGVASLVSCQAVKHASDEVLYRNAMQNAVYPEASKIDNNLVDINDQNPNLIWKTIDQEKYLLVVSWKYSESFYKPYINKQYNTQNYPIWITTSPQLQNWFKGQNPADTNLRLQQLLGLPPNSTYNYFVEFWVKPADLFRPCPDNEITDKACSTCFPPNTDSTYINWINESRISRYYPCNLYDQYPWTQLGYTYDWNPDNKTHFGMSEFVIKPNSNVYVNAIYTTQEYLKK